MSGHHKIKNKKRLIIAIVLNSIITISEYIGGLISGSLALISDAGHNLSDVLSLILGYAGESISEKDATRRYTFGLKRFEVLIALINALSLVVIGIFILYESIYRFFHPVVIDIKIMVPVAVIGLLGNLFSILVLFKDKDSTLNMKAAFLHLFYDTISSIAVIIAGIVIYFTQIFWIDLIMSLVIVAMIIWSTKSIIRESLRIFLQGAPKHLNTEEVYNSIMQVKNVGEIHGLHIWSISSTEVFLSCHISVNNEKRNINTDTIIRNVNAMLEKKFNISHTTLQIEKTTICNLEAGECCR